MNIEQAVIEKLKSLPPQKQQAVLDFAEFLDRKDSARRSHQARQSLEGLWADLGLNITEGDIAEARQEMWGHFPREHSE